MPNGSGIWKQGTCGWGGWEGECYDRRNEEDYDSWNGMFCVRCHRWIINHEEQSQKPREWSEQPDKPGEGEQVQDLERRVKLLEGRIKQMEEKLEEQGDTLNQTMVELCQVIHQR